MTNADTVVVSNSRWRYLVLLCVSLGFVAGGVFILLQDQGAWVGWGSVVFFGACSVVFVWQLVDSRPRLIINDDGILDRTLGVGSIPWSEIQGAFIRSIDGNDFICLEVRDPERYRLRLSPVRRAMASANRALGFTDLSVNLSGLRVNTQELFELIMKRAESGYQSGAVDAEDCAADR